MLITLIFDPIFSAINAFIAYLPEIPIPQAIPSAIAYVFNLLRTVGFLLPLDTVRNVFIIVFSVYAFKFLISSTSYVARKIPTIS